jgi:hypothetical protein
MNSAKVFIGLVVACLAAFAFAFLNRNNRSEGDDEL